MSAHPHQFDQLHERRLNAITRLCTRKDVYDTVFSTERRDFGIVHLFLGQVDPGMDWRAPLHVPLNVRRLYYMLFSAGGASVEGEVTL